ncbi:MAG: site-2 protease family protein [Acidobacteria bacterium]|nr:site-2 protease family protein [Acidobacteriota bacterium]MBK8813629.1 site-2 protease family protein [Acidobacteriota bacterium]
MPDFDLAEFQYQRRSMRPTRRAYIKHSAFFIITFCTVLVASVLQPFGILPVFANVDPNVSTTDFLLNFPVYYAIMIVDTIWLLFTEPVVLAYGLKFTFSLLFILTSHEFGHYIACRIYGVDATLPFFIPTPPLIGPAGTFGAFIKILSPLPSRRATFDIGVAGPIAGFVALIPIAIAAFVTFEQVGVEVPASLPEGTLVFADPLLFHFFASVFDINFAIPMLPNPFYSAAWLGLLVTALNLIPSGQLDGGHAIYGVFGERFHFWTGRVAFLTMIAFAAAGLYYFNSPSGILFAVLLGVMLKIKHPAPLDDRPLDRTRILVAVITLLIFILSFTPFPIQIR